MIILTKLTEKSYHDYAEKTWVQIIPLQYTPIIKPKVHTLLCFASFILGLGSDDYTNLIDKSYHDYTKKKLGYKSYHYSTLQSLNLILCCVLSLSVRSIYRIN